MVGLYTTELIKFRGLWRSLEQVELAGPSKKRLVTCSVAEGDFFHSP